VIGHQARLMIGASARMTRALGVRHGAAREKLHAGEEREAARADSLAAASGGVRGLIDDYPTYSRARA
jgi:hypothetical protein